MLYFFKKIFFKKKALVALFKCRNQYKNLFSYINIKALRPHNIFLNFTSSLHKAQNHFDKFF